MLLNDSLNVFEVTSCLLDQLVKVTSLSLTPHLIIAHPETMPRTLHPVVMDEATDWSGRIVTRQMSQYLFPDCIVRIVIKNHDNEVAEAIYFRLTKIKDGTFWGTAQDTYRLWDAVGFTDGQQMTFRREHINEIPIDWQPKRFQRAVAHLASRQKNVGYAITGLRGISI